MAESGVFYTSSQINQMQAYLAAAANDTGNSQLETQDLEAYYQVQTSIRGYASLAIQVVGNSGSGIVANQEVKNYLGSSYNPLDLAYRLAITDLSQIQNNGNQVPTLAEDAADHKLVFGQLGIPITYWGGTPFTALTTDFTSGVATMAEKASVTPADFQTMSAGDVQASITNLFNAGVGCIGSLGFEADVTGYFTIQGLQSLFNSRYGTNGTSPVSPLQFGQNADGTYQVTEATASGTTLVSYDTTGEAQGTAITIGSATSVNGTVSDLAANNGTITLGSNATLGLTGSSNTLSIEPATNQTVLATVTLIGNSNILNTGTAIVNATFNGSANTIDVNGLSGTFTSLATRAVGQLGDTSILSVSGSWTGTGIPGTSAAIKVLNSDGSYATTRVVASNDLTNPAPILSTFLHGVNGLIYEGQAGAGTSLPFVQAWSAQGTPMAEEDFTVASGQTALSLASVDFFSLSGNGSSALLEFQPGSQTISSIYVSNTDGSSILYQPPGSDGSWTEDFYNSASQLTQEVRYGAVYDAALGKYITGTEVSTPSGNPTIYQAGDPNAPTAGGGLPAGTPQSYAAAQALWSSIIATTQAAQVTSSGTFTVTSGTTSVDGVVTGTGTEQVASGGVASGTMAATGGTLAVMSGGASTSAVISAGGTEYVSSGAMATADSVYNGGSQVVFSGGIVIADNIDYGGAALVYGADYDDPVFNGGTLTVASGGGAYNLTVDGGGMAIVLAGGNVSNATLRSGGSGVLSSGATADANILFGAQSVLAGAAALGTVVEGGGTETDAGYTSASVLVSGATEVVLAGGTAFGTILESGAIEIVSSGATALSPRLAGGSLVLLSGAYLSQTLIGSGPNLTSSLTVGAGVSASAVTVDAGATLLISGAGAIVTGETVNASGTEIRTGRGQAAPPNSGSVGSAAAYSGANTSELIVSSGASLIAGSDQVTSNAVVLSGGTAIVSSGGTEVDATVRGGGTAVISGGGSTNATVLLGTQSVLAGASALGTVVQGGGSETVAGYASESVLASGAIEVVLAGGTAFGTILESGATEIVSSGASVFSPVLAGGSLVLLSGAQLSQTLIGSGANLTSALMIGAGVIASDVTINAAATLSISGAGAVVHGAFVNSGGVVLTNARGQLSQDDNQGINTDAGGIVSGNAFGSGSMLSVYGAGGYTGLSENNLFHDGGALLLGFDGADNASVISSGSSEIVSSGGSASAGLVSNGGVEIVLNGGQSVAAIVLSGGSLVVSSGGLAGNTVLSGGSLEIGPDGTAAGNIVFAASGATLTVDGATMPGATISGFDTSDSIVLSAIPYSTTDTVEVTAANLVTISAGASVFNLCIAGASVGESDFQFGPGSILTRAFTGVAAGSFLPTATPTPQVTNYPSGNTITYQNGDPNAPSATQAIASGVPTTFSAAQSLWNSLLPSGHTGT